MASRSSITAGLMQTIVAQYLGNQGSDSKVKTSQSDRRVSFTLPNSALTLMCETSHLPPDLCN